MATLNGEPVCPGDKVFDICYGPGTISAVEAGNRLCVSFGSAGRPRKYSENGMTGKLCYQTLFHKPPAIIAFPKDETRAAKLACALESIVEIMNTLTEDCVDQVKPCCEQAQGCEKWQ